MPINRYARTAALALALSVPAAGLVAQAAQAQERWTGPYAGVQLGYGDFDTDRAATGDADGVIGGVHAGYNWDLGDWVWGAEFSYDFADADFDGGGSIEEIARLGGRVGRDLGRTLVYGTAGAAWADADLAGGGSNDETGWFIGGGVDYDVSEQWVVGGRVLYTDIGDLAGPGNDVDGASVELRASFRF